MNAPKLSLLAASCLLAGCTAFDYHAPNGEHVSLWRCGLDTNAVNIQARASTSTQPER